MPTLGVKYDQTQIESAIRDVMQEFPGEIERIRYSIGDDWTSEPALFFRILLADPNHLYEDLPSPHLATQTNFTALCRGIVKKLTTELDSEMYQPYFHFRTVAEQQRLRSPQWD